MLSNGNKPKKNLATAFGPLNKSCGLFRELWSCEGVNKCLSEFFSVQLNNKAMEASRGPISACSVDQVVSLCFFKEYEEGEEKEVRLE